MNWAWLQQRPIVVAVAGSNGAGKTTFCHTFLASSGLRFINPDRLAKELAIDAYAAANLASGLRHALVEQRESFIFETVFSDPAGDKLRFLKETAAAGYTVVLCFIGLSDWKQSEQRVAMRISQGGHDVPRDKLQSRFSRTLANLRTALAELPNVLVFDNSDLSTAYRLIAAYENGTAVETAKQLPNWFLRLTE